MNLQNFKTALIAAAVFYLSAGLMVSALANVRIIRDEYGVPNVYGANNYEVFYGFGYIMSKDRMFQMEMRKRQVLGTVSEVLGKGDKRWADKYLSKDISARLILDRAEIEREYKALPTADKEIIEGFTEGVNTAIQQALADPEHRLSKQFVEFGFLPHFWTPIDVMLLSIDVAGGFSRFSTQVENYDLYQFLRIRFPTDCDDIFNQFLWQTDPNAPTTMGDHQRGGPDLADPGPRGCGISPNGLTTLPKGTGSQPGEALASAAANDPRRGSMAWLVGSHKANGFASLFVSGPQSGWLSPGYYYTVGLHGGDFDFVGFAAEGAPVFKVGVSRYLSWGLTAGLGSQVDEYREQLDRPNGTKYLYNGSWLPIDVEHEIVRVKGEPDQKIALEYTVHGPLSERRDVESYVFAKKIAWRGLAVQSVMAWIHSAAAHDYAQWLNDAHHFAFSCNWFYAGHTGTVGFAYTGAFPIRKAGDDLRLPSSGDGQHEWTGLQPMNHNPSMETRDYIVNFNNKPTRNWPNSGLYWEQWAEANQVDTLIREINAKPRLDWHDMWAINRAISYTDVSAPFFIPFILKAAEKSGVAGDMQAAVSLLANWNRMRTDDNHDGYYDSAAQTIFDAWLPIMVKNTIGTSLEGFRDAKIWLAAGYQTTAPRLEEHPTAGSLITFYALQNSIGQSGVKHYHNFFKGTTADAVILHALQEALAGLHKKYSGPMTGWLQKDVAQPFFNSNTNRIPITSSNINLSVLLFANRGVINLVTGYGLDGKSARAASVNPPGVSGFIPPGGHWQNNPHFADQLALYQNMGLAPLYLDEAEVKKHQSGPEIDVPVSTVTKGKL